MTGQDEPAEKLATCSVCGALLVASKECGPHRKREPGQPGFRHLTGVPAPHHLMSCGCTFVGGCVCGRR